MKKPFENGLRVSGSKLNVSESELKNGLSIHLRKNMKITMRNVGFTRPKLDVATKSNTILADMI